MPICRLFHTNMPNIGPKNFNTVFGHIIVELHGGDKRRLLLLLLLRLPLLHEIHFSVSPNAAFFGPSEIQT